MKAFALLLVLSAFLALIASPAVAQDGSSHDGKVVSAGAGKLVMTDEQGKEHSHAVGPETKITVNGKPGSLEDLKAGMTIRVMLDKDNHVLSISTIDREK